MQAQALLTSSTFRVYTNADVIGTELAGALKNVVAIGAGITDGMELGDNAKAGFLTRGLAEITRLGVAAGAQAATFAGNAGLGDLLATCFSTLSRNHRVGIALAQGMSLAESIDALGGEVAEGVTTTPAALDMARAHGRAQASLDVGRQLAGVSGQDIVVFVERGLELGAREQRVGAADLAFDHRLDARR